MIMVATRELVLTDGSELTAGRELAWMYIRRQLCRSRNLAIDCSIISDSQAGS
jgi:hypothetical protein